MKMSLIDESKLIRQTTSFGYWLTHIRVPNIKNIKMDDPMGDPMGDFEGWRSSDEIESDKENDMEVDMELEESEEQNFSGLTTDQQKVLAVVKNNETEEGADIAFDFAHLKSKFLISTGGQLYLHVYLVNRDKLQEILNWLSDEGHIYSTISENHFKAT